MSLDDNVYVNKEQFADFDLLEDLDIFEHYDSPSIDSSKSFQYLCIPRDPLHEAFPSITSNNQPITWSDLGISTDFENVSFGESLHNVEPKVEKEEEQEVEEIKSVEMIKAGLSGFVIKKPRSKRFCQKGIKKEVFFGEAELKNREQSGTIRDLFAKAKLENREESLKKKCAHCQVQTTPQWRAGPLGPKTLCNACGVRFKSGRLLPEYRPAASPEYDGKKYSNFHKRIVGRRLCIAKYKK